MPPYLCIGTMFLNLWVFDHMLGINGCLIFRVARTHAELLSGPLVSYQLGPSRFHACYCLSHSDRRAFWQ